MKYYETHYEDYINAVKKYNMHEELIETTEHFPKKNNELTNLIFYGPTGVGKYSQVLKIIQKYSPSELKYDKKITIQTDKQTYNYRISDVHYEIDMSMLGCNSKLVWHEIFFQIVDIITVKADKFGIILCKNFHLIHPELLEIFYSYMQQYNSDQSIIKLKFFIITEHISFIPSNIINSCQIFNIKRPDKSKYSEMIQYQNNAQYAIHTASPLLKNTSRDDETIQIKKENILRVINTIDMEGFMNMKETQYFSLLTPESEIPKDIFNIVCDNIIKEILNKEKMSFTNFRDTLYDILTYNLDAVECVWYILRYLIENNYLTETDISGIIKKTHSFLKYYNNNYRPIYHLESMLFYIINKVHKYDEL
uniref:Replication factor C small subunit n=1 Tax=viral metagenome TaxID=1070528 RepID=A0A6C0HB33_9ZZZZ